MSIHDLLQKNIHTILYLISDTKNDVGFASCEKHDHAPENSFRQVMNNTFHIDVIKRLFILFSIHFLVNSKHLQQLFFTK